MTTPAPTQASIQAVLRSFILSIYPTIECIEGQDNRVPEPSETDFIVLTTIERKRLSQNVVIWADVAFTGSISSGNVLSVSNIEWGIIQIGSNLFGTGINPNTIILSQIEGASGGPGVYTLQTTPVISSGTLASGNVLVYQPTQITIQIDFHSANVVDSADMAQTVSTLFRDEVCVDFFQSSGVDAYPLYADDPKQIPFLNSEQQWETRYVLNACIQANQEITWPQQFMGEVSIKEIIAADEQTI